MTDRRQPRRSRPRTPRRPQRLEGVWRCRTTFNRTVACPRGSEVTKAIQEVERALLFTR